jgi:hypothetical protein
LVVRRLFDLAQLGIGQESFEESFHPNRPAPDETQKLLGLVVQTRASWRRSWL